MLVWDYKKLNEFGPDYGFCVECQTLISQSGLDDEALLVKDDETDFYGKNIGLITRPKI